MRLDLNKPEDRTLAERLRLASGATLLDDQLAHERSKAAAPTEGPEEDASLGKSKYRNTVIFREGQRWDSVWEWECWLVLREMQSRGEISKLQRQVRYNFDIEDPTGEMVKVGWWTADYVFEASGQTIVADAKHRATAAKQTWPRTVKLMRGCHGIDVLVLYKGETNVRAAVLQWTADPP